ncbi:hypothetical protein PIB30_080838 [Stylosanthes scabra]|uniref:CASP-like protein n=1 Tax=Stylosanthes scabra TaxID=79078 RepID=A0ABU6XSI2_9FABA|nr:hypothetical protein [Stylosanthes scabra]
MRHRLAASWCFFYVLSSAPSWQLLASIGASLDDLRQSPPFFSITDFFSSLISFVAAGCVTLAYTASLLYLTAGIHNRRWVADSVSPYSSAHSFVSPRMTHNGKTSTKGSAPTAASSTAGNLSQLLLRSCFRKVSKKNSS